MASATQSHGHHEFIITVIINIITPHICDVLGVIVLTSFVCKCACLALTAEQTEE